MLSSQNRAGANRIEENALVWRIEEKSSEFTLFDLSQLLEATENFAEENRLGQGGFGPVYKVNKISIMLWHSKHIFRKTEQLQLRCHPMLTALSVLQVTTIHLKTP